MDERLRAAALEYHLLPQPGKIAVTPTKALTNQADLSLAYSPGVAVPASTPNQFALITRSCGMRR